MAAQRLGFTKRREVLIDHRLARRHILRGDNVRNDEFSVLTRAVLATENGFAALGVGSENGLVGQAQYRLVTAEEHRDLLVGIELEIEVPVRVGIAIDLYEFESRLTLDAPERIGDPVVFRSPARQVMISALQPGIGAKLFGEFCQRRFALLPDLFIFFDDVIVYLAIGYQLAATAGNFQLR